MGEEKLIKWLNSCKKQLQKQFKMAIDGEEFDKKFICAGSIAFIEEQLKEIDKGKFK